MQTPYFIFDKTKLIENYQKIQETAKKFFPQVKIAYSVKTNSSPLVLKTLADLGSGFEVASLKEINLVKPYKAQKVFNSPCKTADELHQANEQDILINIDSLGEEEEILGLKIKKAGIRIAFDESKFGIDTIKLKEVLDYLRIKDVEIICLSSHPGTQQSIKDYEVYTKQWKSFLSSLDSNYLQNLKYFDLGGGFPDNFQLKNLGLEIEDYFKLIKENLAKYIKNKTLIFEPGRFLVSDAFTLITKVHYLKENRAKKYAILDAGINILPKITLASYQFKKNERRKRQRQKPEEYLLAGPLLFSNDILGKFHGILEVGDIFKVENVGAYCQSLAWEISFDKPKIKEK